MRLSRLRLSLPPSSPPPEEGNGRRGPGARQWNTAARIVRVLPPSIRRTRYTPTSRGVQLDHVPPGAQPSKFARREPPTRRVEQLAASASRSSHREPHQSETFLGGAGLHSFESELRVRGNVDPHLARVDRGRLAVEGEPIAVPHACRDREVLEHGAAAPIRCDLSASGPLRVGRLALHGTDNPAGRSLRHARNAHLPFEPHALGCGSARDQGGE